MFRIVGASLSVAGFGLALLVSILDWQNVVMPQIVVFALYALAVFMMVGGIGLALGSVVSAPWRRKKSPPVPTLPGTSASALRPLQATLHVRPMTGDLSQYHDNRRGMAGAEMYAQIAVRVEGASLEKCYVRLESIMQGVSFSPKFPLDAAPRHLRWSSREQAFGEHGQWLDIPNDGTERIADVAVVAREALGHFRIVAADPDDRTEFQPGRYKIVLTVASDSADPCPERVVLFLYYPGTPPELEILNPIILRAWNPDGEEEKKWVTFFQSG